jgi:nucleoside-diphosphate-sugar epimerase
VVVLVTGARGKVGSEVVRRLGVAGHDIVATDRRPATDSSATSYVQADLMQAGDAFAVTRGMQAVVHLAAIADPDRHPDHVVFANNTLAAFHVFQAAHAGGAKRVVHLSSECVYGFGGARHAARPQRLPLDESHPGDVSDPYGLSKQVCESILDSVTRAGTLTAVSLRSAWVLGESDYRAFATAPMLRDRRALGLWSYVDVRDLADAICLALEVDVTGHARVNVGAPDNALGEPLAELARARYGPEVPVHAATVDASGLDSSLAVRLLGFKANHRWRVEAERVAGSADSPRETV